MTSNSSPPPSKKRAAQQRDEADKVRVRWAVAALAAYLGVRRAHSAFAEAAMTEADHWKRAFDWAEAGRQVLKKTAKKLEGAIAALEAELAALEQRRGAYSDRLHSARAAAAQAADERAEATKQLEQALLELQAYIVQEQQIAELAQLAGAKGIKKIWFEVSPKKAITIRGLRRPQYSPVLFQEELLRILAHRRPLLDFIRVHQGELSKRVDKTWKAGRLTTR